MRFLLFAEDAGAAAFVAAVAAALRGRGFGARLVATATAAERLKGWGVECDLLRKSDTANQLLADCDVLATGTAINPYSMGLYLIDVAKWRKIPSIGLVDSHQHIGGRFRGDTDNPLAHAPDWILVPDMTAADNAARYGFNMEHTIVCGHPSFDRIRDRRAKLDVLGRAELRGKLLPDAGTRKVLVFAAEPSVNVYGGAYTRSSDYTLQGRPESMYRTAIVLDELLRFLSSLSEDIYTILRPHPASTDEELADFYGAFDMVARDDDIYDLLYAADITVGMSSILLLEAVLLGRPTFSILPRRSERAWCSSVLAGFTPSACTSEQIEKGLSRALRDLHIPDLAQVDAAYPQGAITRIVDVLCAIGRGTHVPMA